MRVWHRWVRGQLVSMERRLKGAEEMLHLHTSKHDGDEQRLRMESEGASRLAEAALRRLGGSAELKAE